MEGEAAQVRDLIEAPSEETDKIGDVIKLITEIAEQTNLLALNATTEATCNRFCKVANCRGQDRIRCRPRDGSAGCGGWRARRLSTGRAC